MSRRGRLEPNPNRTSTCRRVLAGAGALAVVVGLVQVATPPAGAVPGGPPPAAGAGLHSLVATWAIPASVVARSGAVGASLRVQAAGALHDVVVTPTAVGVAKPATAARTLGGMAAGSTTSVALPFAVTADGTGTVRATVTGRDAANAVVQTAVELDLDATAGRVALSADGLLTARQTALGFQRAALGEPAYAARLAALTTGGAAVAVAVSPSTSGVAPANTAVSGTIRYTASNSSKHPSRTVTVQLRDQDGTAGGTLLQTVTTDGAGHYSATTTTKRTNGTARKLFVKALAAGGGFTVRATGATVPQAIASTPVTATGTAQKVDLTANKTDDNNTAFDVADALVTAIAYTKHINGGATFGPITASFPDAGGTNFTASTGVARILKLDRFDWDVLLHEYGHFVAAKLAIDTSPGGPHSFSQNLAETRGKAKGIALAWSEGFATWFALTAESVQGTAALAIPHVGDSFYDDTEDASFHVPLATNGSFPSIGEDNELSVARFLWHARTDAKLAMTDTIILSTLKTAGASVLSTAVAALLPAAGAAKFDDSDPIDKTKIAHSNDFACALTDQKVAPKTTAPAAGAVLKADTPPAISWAANGAGPSNRLSSFTVQFWSGSWDAKLFESAPQTTTAYTPSAADWKTVVAAKDATGKLPDTVQIVVKGTGTNAPTTGPYKSCAVAVGISPQLTTTLLGPYLTPQPTAPACAGLFPAGVDSFLLSATRLKPSTKYTLKFTLPGKVYPDVALPAFTSNADGEITSVLETLPLMPANRGWKLVATPASGATATTTLNIAWTSCYLLSSTTTPDFTVQWGGAGVKPKSTVTENFNSSPFTATATGKGAYQGSYGMHCTTASNTITVDATILDRSSQISFPGVPCTPDAKRAAGPSSGLIVGY